MKKLNFLIVLLVLLTLTGLSQVPDAFNYQAVVRNSSGEVISNQTVSFRISILKNSTSGTVVFSETQNKQTNSFGLVNLKIGKGTRVSGSFDPANWGTNSHFIKIEFDANGGSSYTLLGTSELLSVPYAFHAQTVEIDNVDDADADATNEIQELQISGTQLSLSKNGGTVTLPSSGGGGDNWGTQTIVSDATLAGEGTTANPLKVANNAIQPRWENIQNLPGGFADNNDDVEDGDANPNNEIQALQLSGTQLSLSKNGGTVTLPSSGGGGDNWGTQTVTSDATLAGEGTTANPLKVANNAIQPRWENIQNLPGGFADNNDDVEDGDANPNNEIQALQLSGTQLSLSKNGGTVTLPSSEGGDNWGTQNVISDATLSGNGTTADPLTVVGDLTDDQTLSLSGNDLSISEGNTVTLPAGIGDDWGSQTITSDTTLAGEGTTANPLKVANNTIQPRWENIQNLPGGFADNNDDVEDGDANPNNEIQTLSVSGNDLSISEGNTVTLPAGVSSPWQTSGSGIFFNSGKVGIGTDNPIEKLEIKEGSIQVDKGSIQVDKGYGIRMLNDNFFSKIVTFNNDLDFFSFSGGNINFYTNLSSSSSTHRMAIQNDGNVGIGTMTPNEILHVVGANPRILIEASSSNPEINFKNRGDISTSIWSIYKNGSTGDLHFYQNGNKLTLQKNTGNVGIGTTTPQGKLDVNGTIYQRGGILHADYVFEEDYQLETIEEHAEFMWENKHLPAIPKATIDENGVEVVEVGSQRKGIVEELEKAHIYISQLEKAIQEQAALINGQELRLKQLESLIKASASK